MKTRNNRPYALSIFIFLLALLLFAQIPPSAVAQTNVSSTSISMFTINQLHTASSIFKNTGEKTSVIMGLNINSKNVLLDIHPIEIRSSNYKSQITRNSGREDDQTKIELFTGTTSSKGRNDFVRLSLITSAENSQETLKGFAQIDGYFYSLTPSENSSLTINAVELSPETLNNLMASCGVENQVNFVPNLNTDSTIRTEALLETEIATEADYLYFQQLGSSTSANAEILNILNGVDAIYRNQLGVTFRVVYQHAWNTPDPYYNITDSGALLNSYTNYWQQNFQALANYDVGHLWTGKNIDSNVIGIAYLSAVCRTYRYGLSQNLSNRSAYDVPLAAHEIGHNFGADHDSCGSSSSFIMCPSLVAYSSTFSSVSIQAINSFLPSASCLTMMNNPPPSTPTPTPTPALHPPVLNFIGSQTVAEYSTLNLNFTASDVDGGPLTFSMSQLREGMSFSGSSFSYSPNGAVVTEGNQSIVFSVYVTVTDNTGLSSSEEVRITVTSVNLPPTITSRSFIIPEGNLFRYQLNGTDPDGDNLSYRVLTALPRGAVFTQYNEIIWRIAGDQAGTYSLPVRATDPYGVSADGVITINVSNTPGVPPLPPRYTIGNIDGGTTAEAIVFRPLDGNWFHRSLTDSNDPLESFQLGSRGDVPVIGDYNGDNISDAAVYQPTTKTWLILYSGTETTGSFSFGLEGDIPVPGDYDGDGRFEPAVFRPALGILIYLSSINNTSIVISEMGSKGDIPVPCDYDGDRKTDIAVYRPASGQWIIRRSSDNVISTTSFGLRADIPIPADYDNSGRCSVAVYRASEQNWYFPNGEIINFGPKGSIPAPADYNGDGKADMAVFQKEGGLWFLRSDSGDTSTTQLGLPSDIVAIAEPFYFASRTTKGIGVTSLSADNSTLLIYEKPYLYHIGSTNTVRVPFSVPKGTYIFRADYDGDGTPDLTTFMPNGLWTIYNSSAGTRQQYWGRTGDIPVTIDADGDGKADLAVFRPSTGYWFIILSSNLNGISIQFGLNGDIPLSGDFDGDGFDEIVVHRPFGSLWYIYNLRTASAEPPKQWGLAGFIPLVGDYDNDGRADLFTFQPNTGFWYIRYANESTLTTQWGLSGDIPNLGAFVPQDRTNLVVYRPRNDTFYIHSNIYPAQRPSRIVRPRPRRGRPITPVQFVDRVPRASVL